VRGFLSGTVRKKLGLDLVSETGKDGRRRYRLQSEPQVLEGSKTEARNADYVR